MIPADIESLQQFLLSQGQKVELQKETQQLFIKHLFNGKEFPLFFRLYKGAKQLQLLVFFPIQFVSSRNPHMARFLHKLNKEIDLPGFGMDEEVGLVFHRTMLILKEGKIDPYQIDIYLDAIKPLCTQCYPVIAQLATSGLTYDEFTKNAPRK
jgi:hypothetical protein